MRRNAVLGCMLLLLSAATVIAGASFDEAVQQMIAGLNDIAKTLEDSKTVDEAKPKLDKSIAKLGKLKETFENKKPGAEEEAKLKEKYGPQMQQAMGRLFKAVKGISERDPGGEAKLKDLFDQLKGGGQKETKKQDPPKKDE